MYLTLTDKGCASQFCEARVNSRDLNSAVRSQNPIMQGVGIFCYHGTDVFIQRLDNLCVVGTRQTPTCVDMGLPAENGSTMLGGILVCIDVVPRFGIVGNQRGISG